MDETEPLMGSSHVAVNLELGTPSKTPRPFRGLGDDGQDKNVDMQRRIDICWRTKCPRPLILCFGASPPRLTRGFFVCAVYVVGLHVWAATMACPK